MGARLPADCQISALICSRLCHDLVGPVGAVNNGVELLADGDDQELLVEAQALIAKSAGQAVRRLRFYRIAFGATSGATISRTTALEAVEPMLADSNLTLDWRDSLAADDPAQLSLLNKLGLNLILIATDAMPRGGTITLVTEGGAAAPRLTLVGAGPMATVEQAALAALESGARTDQDVIGDLTARGAQPYYAGRMAASLGLAVTVAENGPSELKIACAP